jgi:GNAT superfamily N-acetyltransferase
MRQFVFEPLAKHHDRLAFRCGVPELDEYLQRRARQDAERHVAAVYVMVPADEPQRIAGFYTLSSASVILDELPADLRSKLPRYPTIPAVLLGRLARNMNFPGLGSQLLMDALHRALRHSVEVAAVAILVDAKNEHARQFYARYGFQQSLHSPDRMFLPMKTVEQLFS